MARQGGRPSAGRRSTRRPRSTEPQAVEGLRPVRALRPSTGCRERQADDGSHQEGRPDRRDAEDPDGDEQQSSNQQRPPLLRGTHDSCDDGQQPQAGASPQDHSDGHAPSRPCPIPRGTLAPSSASRSIPGLQHGAQLPAEGNHPDKPAGQTGHLARLAAPPRHWTPPCVRPCSSRSATPTSGADAHSFMDTRCRPRRAPGPDDAGDGRPAHDDAPARMRGRRRG